MEKEVEKHLAERTKFLNVNSGKNYSVTQKNTVTATDSRLSKLDWDPKRKCWKGGTTITITGSTLPPVNRSGKDILAEIENGNFSYIYTYIYIYISIVE